MQGILVTNSQLNDDRNLDIINAFYEEGFMVKKLENIECVYDPLNKKYIIVTPIKNYILESRIPNFSSMKNTMDLLWSCRRNGLRMTFLNHINVVIYERNNEKYTKLDTYSDGCTLSISDGILLMVVSTCHPKLTPLIKEWLDTTTF